MSERIGTDTAETLPGSFGADLIIGLAGGDRIEGNAGSDTLSGNADNDTVFGGFDNDFVIGGRDEDLLTGDDGNDTIFGNKGNDAIDGGSGNDVIFGGQDNDVIEGGSGSDVIWGDLGADSLIGGTGSDLFVLTATGGGATQEEADTIVDFDPRTDRIGLSDSINTASLNVTFQAIANSSSFINVIIQDLSTGQFLATLKTVSRSAFLNNDIFTDVITPSENIDTGSGGSDGGSDGGSGGGSGGDSPNTVTRESVGKSAPLTANSTIVAFEDTTYTFSASDFSFFDIDNDAFAGVRVVSLPAQGDLFVEETTTDAETGETTTNNTAVTAGSLITTASLSALTFVPDPGTQGADYASFTFRVSDGANLSNTATASIVVKDKSLRVVGESDEAAPTIDGAVITTSAKEPENGLTFSVPLFSDIDLFDDSGNLTSATIALTGGSPQAGEDVLRVLGLPDGITASAYDATNRTLTLSGTASVDDYETAIKLIDYTNTVNTATKPNRTVTVSLTDAIGNTTSGSYTLTVAADDDVIELKNADNSTLTATESADDSTLAANKISVPNIFADATPLALALVDPDTSGSANVTVNQIQVSISRGFQSGADSLVYNGSTSAVTVTPSADKDVLTLTPTSGSATTANYIDVLKAIEFENNSDSPTSSMRTISIQVTDGDGVAAPVSTVRNIDVQPVNDPPVLKNADNSTLTATESADDSTLAANKISVPNIFADATPLALALVDPDTGGSANVTVNQIQVSISAGFQSGADSLVYNGSTSAVTVTPSLGKDVLTLTPTSGSATTANYIDVLKAIEFENNSDSPDSSMRTISIQVTDGDGVAAPVSEVRDINVQPVNDLPVLGNLSFTESETYAANSGANLDFSVADLVGGSGVNASDRDDPLLGLGLKVTAVTAGASGGQWKYSNNGIDFTALIADQTISNSGTLRFSGATNGTGTPPSLTFEAWDGEDSSAASGNIAISVTGFINSATGNETLNLTSASETVVYDALTDGTDTITGFNPSQDKIRLTGAAFNASADYWDDNNDGLLEVFNAGNSNTTVNRTEDIVFWQGNDGSMNSTINNFLNGKYQPSLILVQRKPSPPDEVNIFYVTGANTTSPSPNLTKLATLGRLNTATGPVLSGLDADDQWDTFISRGAQAFEVV